MSNAGSPVRTVCRMSAKERNTSSPSSTAICRNEPGTSDRRHSVTDVNSYISGPVLRNNPIDAIPRNNRPNASGSAPHPAATSSTDRGPSASRSGTPNFATT
jgi:hypothetical protein